MDYILREAQKLLKEFGTSNPKELADYLDIKVIEYPLSNLHGIYFKIENHKFSVINSNLHFEEQRYILLHEIAHARLHPEENYFAIKEDRLILTGKYERQADLFAAALFLKDTPDEYKNIVGNQLLTRVPGVYLKKLLTNSN